MEAIGLLQTEIGMIPLFQIDRTPAIHLNSMPRYVVAVNERESNTFAGYLFFNFFFHRSTLAMFEADQELPRNKAVHYGFILKTALNQYLKEHHNYVIDETTWPEGAVTPLSFWRELEFAQRDQTFKGKGMTHLSLPVPVSEHRRPSVEVQLSPTMTFRLGRTLNRLFDKTRTIAGSGVLCEERVECGLEFLNNTMYELVLKNTKPQDWCEWIYSHLWANYPYLKNSGIIRDITFDLTTAKE